MHAGEELLANAKNAKPTSTKTVKKAELSPKTYPAS